MVTSIAQRSSYHWRLAQLRLLLLCMILLQTSTDAFSRSSNPLGRTTTTTRRRPHSRLIYSSSSTSSSKAAADITTDSSITTSLDEEKKNNSAKQPPRPLQQNWWPVTLSAALDPSRPNPVELLDQKLVLWCTDDDDDDDWSCLDDACAHRFAPLSEGRVIENPKQQNKRCLQCAYHGWEFNGHGTCTRVPQQQETQEKQQLAVKSYPVRQAAGMVWIWADPSTAELSKRIPLPVSSLLERYHQQPQPSGPSAPPRGFMRDLPYGMELLGENLVDISHLPYSHHSVGALNRQDGRPVPLKMLSKEQRQEVAQQQNTGTAAAKVLPLFQASVIDALQHDPELVAALKNPMTQAQADPELAVSTVGFFDPCHVRYHRNPGIPGSSYEIQLFMCPKSAGSSRVFLFTPFEAQLKKKEDGETGTTITSKVKEEEQKEEEEEDSSPNNDQRKDDEDSELNNNNSKRVPRQNLIRLVRELFGTTTRTARNNGALTLSPLRKKPASGGFPPYFGCMVANNIFDGDGIFLHKQGDRMRRSKLTYRDYQTPTSSDAMVNAFRRWLDSAAAVTDSDRVVAAATGGDAGYLDNRSREDMLDRYNTHTIHCKVCFGAVKEMEAKRDKLQLVIMTLLGASGASGFLTVATALLSIVARFRGAAPRVMLSCALATAGAVVAAKKSMLAKEKLNEEIQKFYFVDYVHSEKN